MVIKINYTNSDVYVSTSVSPVYVVVNYSGTTTGAAVWGQITGTLSNQTDLQNALDAKFDDPTGTTAQYLRGDGSLATFPTIPSGTVTSVGLTMPSAFSVANSPITSSGTLAVTGAGTASQYVRGDGQLATLPSGSSGGSSVAYYLNGSVAASVGTYYQMSKTAVIGTGTDFSKAGNGLISQFLTDVADPNRLEIPAGAWNFEMYFSASSSGGTPAFYVELLKYDGTTFTSIASSSAVPEAITSGTLIDLYLTSLAIPQTTLLSTDRLAIRVYIVNSTGGRTITMHTENSHLCEIITNFAGGVSALNGLTANTQYFATGTSGTDFAISSATDTHTFNLPTASATNRGALSSADWSTFSGKVGGSGATGQVAYWNGTNSQTGSNNLFWDAANARLGIGTATPSHPINILSTNAALGFRLEHATPSSASFPFQITITGDTNYIRANVNIIEFFRNGGASTIRTKGSNNDLLIQSFRNLQLAINDGTIGAQLFSTGNLVLQNGGTFTDGGQRLQVMGDAFIKGSGATSATTALSVQNSAGNNMFRIANNGAISLGNSSLRANIFTFTTNQGAIDFSGTNLSFYNSTSNLSATSGAFAFGGDSFFQTTGNQLFFSINMTFVPTSGTATFASLNLSPGINQTGGANGITRGLYVTPTLTAAADWRSIEWSNNSGWGLYGAGTAANLLNGATTINNIVTIDTTTQYALRLANTSKVIAGHTGAGGSEINLNLAAVISGYSSLNIRTILGTDITLQTGSVTKMQVFGATGNVVLQNGGTFTDAGFRLDVNGTARVSGASTFNGAMTVAVNQNGATLLTVRNQTSGTAAAPILNIAGANGNFQLVKNSPTTNAYKIFGASDAGIYNDANGDIGILNDNASGTIKFAAGASSTAHLTIESTGKVSYAAATTAKAQINLASGTAPTSPVNGDIWFDGTDLKMRIGGVTKTFTLV